MLARQPLAASLGLRHYEGSSDDWNQEWYLREVTSEPEHWMCWVVLPSSLEVAQIWGTTWGVFEVF